MLALGILIIVLVYCLYDGVRRPGGVYGYSFLAAAVIAGFFLPQLIGLRNVYGLPKGGWIFVVVLTTLIAIMCHIGSRLPVKVRAASTVAYDENRLFHVAAFFSIVGAIAFLMLGNLSEDELSQTRWTGAPVAYLFIAKLSVFGLAISAIYFLKTRSLRWLLLAAAPLAFYSYRIVFLARRGDTIEIAMILVLALWFTYRKAVPGWLFLTAIVFATVIIPSTGAYRSAMSPYSQREQSLGTVFNQDSITRNFETIVTRGGLEVRNAIFLIDAIGRYDKPNLGIAYYNELVRLYFPAQIFGAQTKQSLLVDMGQPGQRLINYRPATGTTLTGLVDSYASFRMFGVLAFLLIAWNLRTFQVKGEHGSLLHQIMYMTLINDGMQALTHSTSWYVGSLVYTAIFLLPMMMYAKVRVRSAPRPALAALTPSLRLQ